MNIKLMAFGFVLLLTTNVIASAKEAGKSPNIIYILADDMGYGDVSCNNENSKIVTPNIDKLASNGVRFTDAHTSSSVCTPTRYGILTGRYNWRSTLKESVLSGFSKSLIKQKRITVAEFLKSEGYNTAYIGKWHLGWDWSIIKEDPDKPMDNLNTDLQVDYSKPVTNGPKTHGFDYSYGFCGSLDMAPYVWVENEMPTMIPTKITKGTVRQAPWREGLTSDDFDHEQVLPDITKKAVSYIQKVAKKENPFFLYFPLPAPHTPILPTAQFKGKSGLDNPYGDFVLMVDWVVGEISKTLKEQNIEENTILIFTTDNGCSPTADFGQLAKKGHHPNYIYRGHKADIFEGGHRVPHVVSWPKRVKPGVTNQLTCTTDLFATVADILKSKYKDNVAEDSYSFLPALNVKSKAKKRETIVHHSINGSFAIRKGDWKVIFCPGSGGWSGPRSGSKGFEELPKVQLYNLKDDASETNNLQDKHPEIVEEFRKILAQYVQEGRSTEGKAQKNDGPEFWPQLKWMNE